MKIVHALGWYFPDALGGTEVYVNGLAQRLKKCGHQVAIAAPLRGLEKSREYEHEGIPVFRYPLRGSSATRDECQIRVPVCGSEILLAWLAKQAPDLLHVHSLLPGISIYEIEAARAMGIRVVVTNHLPDLGYICQRGTLMRWGQKLCDGKVGVLKCSACSLHAAGMPRAISYPAAALSALIGKSAETLQGRAGTVLGMAALIRHRQALQQRLLNAADAFVLLNQAAFDFVLLNGAAREKLAVNLGGVISAIARKPPADLCPTGLPIRFGYVGRFAEIKGAMELAQAWRELPPDLPATLEWVGPANDVEARALVRRLKSMLGQDRRVRFAEAVPPSQVGEVMRRLDVLLVPSRCFEIGPIVMYEAFAAGTPVVGTRIGAMPERIRDRIDGRLLTPGSISEIKEAIQEIAADPAGTVDAWRQALPMPRTMDEIAADYESLYLEVMNRKPTHVAGS
jgi:glycosyltransferase involved in cell wall biosynthesis